MPEARPLALCFKIDNAPLAGPASVNANVLDTLELLEYFLRI